MKKIKISVLKGDGIGPEVVNAAISVLKTIESFSNWEVNLVESLIGAASIEEYGTPLTEDTLNTCKKSDAILFGAIGDPKYDNAPDLKIRPEQGLLRLRKELGLFANVRPVVAYDELVKESPLKADIIRGVDLVICRELTGGIYFGKKGLDENGTAYDHCTYNTNEIDRILIHSFKLAQQRRKKLTLVDKANVLETSRLWRKRANVIKERFPDIELDYLFVDNAAMQLILNPKQFDVIVTENMFGDILSDEASVIAGSIGLLASASVGDGVGLFEPIHGSYPQAKNKNKANPIATILSLEMMFRYLKLNDEADQLLIAVNESLKRGIVTADLDTDSNYGTKEVTEFIIDQLTIQFNKINYLGSVKTV